MGGDRITQLQDAATTILTQIGDVKIDVFNILTYHTSVTDWKSSNQGNSHSIGHEKVGEALDFVLKTAAGGGTDINKGSFINHVDVKGYQNF